MCNSDRPSRFDLFLEQRDHRSIAPQNIPKTDRHKISRFPLSLFRFHTFFPGSRSHTVIRFFLMPVQIRQDHWSPQFPQPVHSLDHHFTQPLTRSHDIRRIDRLIRTDQHKLLAPALQCRAGSLIRPQDIILYGFTGTRFHQRHMLMCRRMIDHIRSILSKHTVDPPAVPH